jgi:hypothetical protein
VRAGIRHQARQVLHICFAPVAKESIKTDFIFISLIFIILLIFIMHILLIISIILQVRVDQGIPDHFWQEKRAAIAASIDGLGDKFKPELRAAWLAYIRETYPDGLVAEPDNDKADIMGTARWRL